MIINTAINDYYNITTDVGCRCDKVVVLLLLIIFISEVVLSHIYLTSCMLSSVLCCLQVQVVGYLHDWQPKKHHGGTFVYYNSDSPTPDVRSCLSVVVLDHYLELNLW
jgi:hypothetical protein